DNGGAPATDQRGRPRLLDGEGIGFPLMDIGAVEYEPADVGLSGSATPQLVAPGQPLTYHVTVTAGGDSNASTVILTIPLPAHTTFQSFMVPPGWAIFTPPVGAGGTVKAYLASLARGTSAAFTLSVLVDAGAPGGTLATTASVTISSPDPNPANNNATLTTAVSTVIIDKPTTPTTPTTPATPARAVVASLVSRKLKGKKTLFVRVVYAETGALKAEARSPFQNPAFKAVRAVAVDTDGDGVPVAVQVSARKGKKTLTVAIAV